MLGFDPYTEELENSVCNVEVKMIRVPQIVRCSLRGLKTRQITYSEHGDPSKVVSLATVELSDKLADNEVHVKWIAAPVNPADLNQIQGVYPVKPPLPAVGGNEGFGRVVRVGANVSGLREGDHVIPFKSGLGTWREDGYHKQNEVFPINKQLSLEASATLQVNPSTAYRMLHDFVHLKQGDTVIQNGASSAVGRAAIQICKAMGVKTVNLVRKRDDMNPIVEELTKLGADLVITEEQLLKDYRKTIKNVPLALNCVGGRSTMFLANTLGQQGVLVTYGGMSKQPLQIPTGPFIFRDIKLAGFWMSRWYEQPENREERDRMYTQLAKWYENGQLTAGNFDKCSMDNCSSVIDKAGNSFDRKQLFIM